MQKGEYIVIKVADIEDEINKGEKFINQFPESSTGMRLKIAILKSLLINHFDLYEIVEGYQKIAQMSDCGSHELAIIRMKEIAINYLSNL